MADGELTEAQLRALQELTTLTDASNDILVAGNAASDDGLLIALDVNTTSFTRADGGLPVLPRERVYVLLTANFPWVPPRVEVDHDRWEDHAHVLQGRRLCLHLDPVTEWNPAAGIAGFLERLWDWFDDAIAGRFDPATALYHAVGGVLHRTEGTPTLVASEPIGHSNETFVVRNLTLQHRGCDRINIVAWDRTATAPETFRGVFVILPKPLPRGGGSYVSDMAIAIRTQMSRHQRKQFLSELQGVASSLKSQEYLYAIFAVPNRHLTRDARFHLIGWRLARPLVNAAINAARRRHDADDLHGDEPPVEWCYVDDTRPAITTRRDYDRPANAFAGKEVDLWGCGALGSWIAELLTRAGANRLILRDTGYVTRGLLVRQNYDEADVGRRKVDALADRLRAISDTVVIEPLFSHAEAGLLAQSDADLIVDATVSTSVAVAISAAQSSGACTRPVVQVSTDSATATLGILTIARGERRDETNDLDKALMAAADADPALAPFRTFWDADSHPTLTPTLGCSVPTFHGSAADTTGIAASAVSLAGLAIQRGLACGYLFASPHTPYAVPACTHVQL